MAKGLTSDGAGIHEVFKWITSYLDTIESYC